MSLPGSLKPLTKDDGQEVQCGVQAAERLAGVRAEGQGLPCGKGNLHRPPQSAAGDGGSPMLMLGAQGLKMITSKLEASSGGAQTMPGPHLLVGEGLI